jgi:hypothetical protein
VDLSRRAPYARILELLARRRREAPGEPISTDEIVSAGWPGERMLVEAALNRAYVALSALRRLGLRDVLRTGGGGYWLDPAIALTIAPHEGSHKGGAGVKDR